MIATLAAEASLFNPESLQSLLAASAEQHRHLCPRQVLGIRLGLYGLRLLGLLDETSGCFDNAHKRLLTIMETDGCGADGVAVATNCHVGRRTLRVVDYGKMAATLVDTQTDKAIRVAPRANRASWPHFCPRGPQPLARLSGSVPGDARRAAIHLAAGRDISVCQRADQPGGGARGLRQLW